MSHHIDASDVRALLAGQVTGPDAERLARHLDACPHCAARVQAADPVADLLESVPSPAIPADLASRALARATQPSSQPELPAALAVLALAAATALFSGIIPPALNEVALSGAATLKLAEQLTDVLLRSFSLTATALAAGAGAVLAAAALLQRATPSGTSS